MHILDELYNGNVHPAEYRFPKEGTYGKALKNAAEAEAKLTRSLNDDQKALLDQFRQCQMEADLIDNFHAFRSGFRLGAQIMMDVLSDSQA